MTIQGAGTIDEYEKYMSSAHGELQGQTAAAIIIQRLLHMHNALQTPVHFYGDNQGVQSKCTTYSLHNLKTHREANSGLLLEYRDDTRNIQKQVHWVHSHQDDGTPWTATDDLKELKLSHEATLNVWCDRMADQAHLSDHSYPDADVLPSEKWALYSCVPVFHKIMCSLDNAIATMLHHQAMLQYITKKHGITEQKLLEMRTDCMEGYLKKQKPHARAATVKLIHRWIPTNNFLHKQG